MNEHNATVVIAGLILAVALICGLSTAATLTRLTAVNTARIAEAHAREAEARAAVEAARVEQEYAAGVRAVLEASARSVATNSELVEYIIKRGDNRAREIWQWVVAGLVGVALVVFALLRWTGRLRYTQLPDEPAWRTGGEL